MEKTLQKSILSLSVVSICAIVALAIVCLASLGFSSKISTNKEEIEVITQNTNSNLTD